jgi:hypothetical protein
MDYPRFSTSLRSNIIGVCQYNHNISGSGTAGVSKLCRFVWYGYAERYQIYLRAVSYYPERPAYIDNSIL